MPFRIYTRTGDQGETSLFGGRRLSKDHLRIDAYGTVDELNAHIGLLRDQLTEDSLREELKQIQDLLFSIGSSLATDPEKMDVPAFPREESDRLEAAMDRMDEALPELRNFIIPGGHPLVSQSHVARCVCRRAERLVVGLARHEAVDEQILAFLNRLSDYFFVLARFLAKEFGAEEVIWTSRT